MAAENIKEVKPLFFEAIGARRLCVGEIIFPKKYKTVTGCIVSETQLKELGLTDGLVDCGWIITAGKAAKNAEQPILQFTITNPSATPYPAGEQVVGIQAYESITTDINKELAAESTKTEEAIVVAALIGR